MSSSTPCVPYATRPSAPSITVDKRTRTTHFTFQGLIRTDLTTAGAAPITIPADRFKEPDVPAETAVWLATLPDSGPRGGFFRNKQPIAW